MMDKTGRRARRHAGAVGSAQTLTSRFLALISRV